MRLVLIPSPERKSCRGLDPWITIHPSDSLGHCLRLSAPSAADYSQSASESN